MAGDWLKVRARMHEEPEVLRMCQLTGDDPYSIVGRLCVFWGWAGEKTVTGELRGVTPFVIDTLVSREGFFEAMRDVGWIEITDDGTVTLPQWKKYNANNRKQRELAAARQARHRWKKRRDVTRDVTRDSNANNDARREEKRIEENIDKKTFLPSSAAETIFAAYPRKEGKGAAIKAIQKALKCVPFEELFSAVKEFADSPKGKSGQFCPQPATWFNQERWTDDRAEWQRGGTEQPRTRDVSGGAGANFRDGSDERGGKELF